MKSIRIAAMIALVLSLVPFAFNIAGKNIFLNLTSNKKTIIVAASHGLCHCALTTENTETHHTSLNLAEFLPIEEIDYQPIFKAGPVDLFTEKRQDPLALARFDLGLGDDDFDYSYIEFPWLLFSCILLILLLVIRRDKSQPS